MVQEKVVKSTDEPSLSVALKSSDRKKWIDAIEEEFDCLSTMILGTRWTLSHLGQRFYQRESYLRSRGTLWVRRKGTTQDWWLVETFSLSLWTIYNSMLLLLA